MRAAIAAMAILGAGAFGGAGLAAADPGAPSADQLTSDLQVVLNTGASDAERAAKLQGGQAAVPTANNIANQMNRYSALFDWRVQNPTVNGDRVDAQLAVTVPVMGTRTHDIYWVQQDGDWKLSNASACVIATQVAATECTV
ncbi:hypothetical protein [Mycolicibacterium chitae]|uniref:Low molecular weight antigen MTB12-like C-terminal domain-containing protein n=1 Tax=Mycolicibacterium chitae TaxID=1792 RepID=A0A448IA66_MYCCI|nr:hypothetical protein [Mycolicibacterium chitae]MCV7105038.1 hypothetical protein [Mycolicibacterium chitae]VEG49293.1 Uncharacterised protein [Mycolicibacterium chitae]